MKRSLMLSIAVATVISITGCGNNNKDQANGQQQSTMTKVVEKTKEVANKATEKAKEATEKAKEVATKATEKAKEVATKATEKAKEVATKATEKAKEVANKATGNETKDAKKDSKASADAKGKALYAKCAGCHGANGKTKALGKSNPIAGWDAAKVEEALKGYKAGSRNVHGMGTMMKGQVSSLSDEDIKALAKYISGLK
jgi:cytochrome c553